MRPRIRTLKPEIWADERIGDLSHGARLLFLGLITMADDEGRFRAPTNAILGHIFPHDPEAQRRLRGWVGEVKDSGLVLFYVVDEKPYGAFRHWKRHQKINRAVPSRLPDPPDHDIVSDNSVKDHESFMDGSLSHAQARVPDPDPSSEVVVRLAVRLAERVRANDPKADPDPRCVRWLTDMRLLLRDRSGDVAEVERIIDWCQSDPFWRSNILSPAKLRKQFTQLVLKADAPKVVSFGRRESTSEMLRALDGEG